MPPWRAYTSYCTSRERWKGRGLDSGLKNAGRCKGGSLRVVNRVYRDKHQKNTMNRLETLETKFNSMVEELTKHKEAAVQLAHKNQV